jgi:hypothetical protein
MQLILLTLVVALIAPPSQRGAEIQLNLAAVAPPPERPSDRRVGEGCGSASGSSSHAPPTKPLKVTLADTDRLAYTVGESMFFNVVLENTGAAPIVLGMSRDPEVAPKTMRPCQIVPPGVHFRVALVAMSKKGPGMIITNGVGFYGSFDVPGTTVVLEPGGTSQGATRRGDSSRVGHGSRADIESATRPNQSVRDDRAGVHDG